MQPPDMVALSVGSVRTEPSGLPDTLGQIFREITDVATSFLGATWNALDVHLGSEPTTCTGSVSSSHTWSQVGNGVPVLGSAKAFARGSHIGSRSPP